MEQERVNKLNHVQMLKLEDTIRDLKVAQQEQKKIYTKSKQTERLNEAAEKIDLLMKANT